MNEFRLKKRWTTLLPLVLSCLLWNCPGEKAQERHQGQDLGLQQGKEKIVLKIKDSSYYNADFEDCVREMAGDELYALPPESLSRLLDNFIEEKLLLQAVRDRDLALTWEEKKGYLAKLVSESWSGAQKEPVDEAKYRNLFDRLLIEKYIYELVKDLDVEEEEIQEYYDLHKREFLRPERVEVSQILLKTEDKAIAVLERLQGASEEEFRDMAEEESVGVEAERGGKMGLFEMGELPFEMEKVVFSLKEGELSQVVESSYGYHIFRMDRRYEPELIALEEASPSIKVKILDQKIKLYISQHIEELKNRMVWSFYPQNLFFPYQRNNP